MKNPIPYIFIIPNFVEQEFIAVEITKYKLTKPMQHQSKPFSRKKTLDFRRRKFRRGEITITTYNTEAKLHFAYTSKNMTDNTTGKN